MSLEEVQAAELRERAAVAESERRLQELRARDDALSKARAAAPPPPGRSLLSTSRRICVRHRPPALSHQRRLTFASLRRRFAADGEYDPKDGGRDRRGPGGG